MPTDEVFKLRRENLRALIRQHEGATSLAKMLGYSSPSYLSQMVGPRPVRQVTEKVARGIEQRLRMPNGWLDKKHDSYVSRIDEGSVSDTIVLVGQMLSDTGTKATPRQFAELVALAQERGALDETYIRRLLSLLGDK
jgi:hypothetical protein